MQYTVQLTMDVRVCFVVVFAHFVCAPTEPGSDNGAAAVVLQTCQVWFGGWDPSKNWNSLVEHTNNLVSQTKEVTDQIVQSANQNLKPVSKSAGLGGQLLHELSTSKDNHEKLNALSATITEAIKLNVHESREIPPLEIDKLGKYVCGGNGKVSNLSTIRHVLTSVCDKEDSYEIRVAYSFDKLKFHYEKFYVKSLGAIGLDGEMDLQFKENKIEIVIGVPSINTMAQKIPLNIINPSAENCIIRIIDFTALILKYDNHDLLARSYLRRTAFSSQMDSYFKEHEDELKQQFETQTFQEFHRILTEESALSALVCNDDELKELIKRKEGSVEPPKRSSNFNGHCA